MGLLSPAKDIQGQAVALDQLESWKSTAFYRDPFEDPADLWSKNMLEPARNGDPSELRENFVNGCSFYLQNNP